MEKILRQAFRFGTCFALLLMLLGSAQGAVLYVKTTGLDTNNGLSWVSPKKTVKAAIDASVSGGEVWVAFGTYTQCIKLKDGVSVYGGFAGGEVLRTQRNPAAYVTILDGGSVDSVVTAPAGATSATVIDGFTIQNGRGVFGGGVFASNSSITISNNSIKNNKALYYGGGIYGEKATIFVLNNSITGNRAPFGGGIACYDSSAPSIVKNTISSNSADYDGSGIYCYSNSNPVISNNLITSNTAASEGAGVYCDDASPVIVNNTLSGNNAATHGGGLACRDASPVLANNIIAFGNSGIRSIGAGNPSLRNNCLYNNTLYGYSGLSSGAEDLAIDPSFVNFAAGNYRLSSTSTLINLGVNDIPGIPTTDLAGAPRIQGGAVDIGAYEATYTLPAITSLFAAKSAANNRWVSVSGTSISAVFPGAFYIEADNRVSGIRVEKAGQNASTAMRATVEGVVRTNANGERYIHANTVDTAPGGDTRPLYMKNRAIGGGKQGFQEAVGIGLNNIGLLVKTSGKLTYDPSNLFFTIDDGSRNKIKCIIDSNIAMQPSWTFVTVTGVSSCEKIGNELQRVIRVRNQNDIQGQ